MDIALITLLLRWAVVILMFWCAAEVWGTTTALQNKALRRIVKKIALGIFAFGAGRLFASLFDNYLAFDIGIFSNLVNYGFWCWILYYVRKNRIKIQSEVVGAQGRQRLSELVSDILIEMDGRVKHISGQ